MKQKKGTWSTKKKWTKELVDKEILNLVQNNENNKLTSAYVRENNGPLYNAAHRIYKNWRNALESNGIQSTGILREQWTKEKIIQEIQNMNNSDTPPNYANIKKCNLPLFNAIRRHFNNGLKEACSLAGLDYSKIQVHKKHNGKWSKKELIKEILRLHQDGIDLSPVYSRNNNHIYNSVCDYFGSWKNAIKEAGIDYDKIVKHPYRFRWNKDRIIEVIRDTYKKGISISPASINKLYPGFTNNCTRFYGKYEFAVEIAGFNYREILYKDLVGYSKYGLLFESLFWDVVKIMYPGFYWRVKRGKYTPDFSKTEKGLWIDTKLTSFLPYRLKNLEKYLTVCSDLLIVFLIPLRENTNVTYLDGRLIFKNIDTYYKQLKSNNRNDLINEFESLKEEVNSYRGNKYTSGRVN